jgi:cytochrome c peroxidase
MTVRKPTSPSPQNPDEIPADPGAIVQPDGEVIAVAVTPRGHVITQSREPAALQIATAGGARIPLSFESRADTGHALFHANTNRGLACASCHPEGAEDGRVWVFDKIGARRTQTLRGGILKTAPFHWNGDLKSMSHLMQEVFESRMSGPKMSAQHHDALGRFIDTMPALPSASRSSPEAVERGRALYFSAAVGCATSHKGAMFTDNRTIDVGTGRALQVPHLRNIADRAPFMHDGCAATLADRFTNPKCGGGDKHGVTSKLQEGQIADLVAFLETL